MDFLTINSSLSSAYTIKALFVPVGERLIILQERAHA